MAKTKVMVAIRSENSVQSLMALACQLCQGTDAELAVLHVVEVPLVTPLDIQDEAIDHAGKELLAQAKRVGEKFSRPLSTELLRAREAGEAIVGVAKEQGVDLLVIGHHKPHPHTLSDTLWGGIVRYVGHHAPCRVIVQIPAPEHR